MENSKPALSIFYWSITSWPVTFLAKSEECVCPYFFEALTLKSGLRFLLVSSTLSACDFKWSWNSPFRLVLACAENWHWCTFTRSRTAIMQMWWVRSQAASLLPDCYDWVITQVRSYLISPLREGFPPQRYFISFHLHDFMKFWLCLHSSIVFGKIFLCKSILCVEIPAEAFFVDLGNRLIEIFQMTDSLAGRLAFQNANIFTQHHLPFKMHINVKCTRDKASFW